MTPRKKPLNANWVSAVASQKYQPKVETKKYYPKVPTKSSSQKYHKRVETKSASQKWQGLVNKLFIYSYHFKQQSPLYGF